MSELLFRAIRRLLFAIAGFPVTVWNHYQWQERKYRETKHLLRLEPYLLRDMGLMREGNRIVAADGSRIKRGAPHHPDSLKSESNSDSQIRHAS